MVLAPIAEATVLRGLTLTELRTRAERVVEGKVIKVRSLRSEGRVETEVTVRVRRAHKGDFETRIRLRALGGEMGNRQMLVPGAPTFARGDEVLLFLYADGDSWRPVGMFQGVWRLDGGTDIARPSDARGASLMMPEDGRAAVLDGARRVSDLVGFGGAQ